MEIGEYLTEQKRALQVVNGSIWTNNAPLWSSFVLQLKFLLNILPTPFLNIPLTGQFSISDQNLFYQTTW